MPEQMTHAERLDAEAESWRNVHMHLRAHANAILKTDRTKAAFNLTAVDESAEALCDIAAKMRAFVAKGESDPLHLAAVMLADASSEPEFVHGELIFNPLALDDFAVDDPIGGRWCERGEVSMTMTTLPVLVPAPCPADGPELPQPGTAAWRIDCRDRVENMLGLWRNLRWEELLPDEPATLKVA